MAGLFFGLDELAQQKIIEQIEIAQQDIINENNQVFLAAARWIEKYNFLLKSAELAENSAYKLEKIGNMLNRIRNLSSGSLIKYLEQRNQNIEDYSLSKTAIEIERELFEEYFRFQNAVNKIIDQKISLKVVYVNRKTKEVTVYQIDDEINLAKKLSISGESGKTAGLQAKIPVKVLKAEGQKVSENDKKINVQGLKDAYLECLTRFNRSKTYKGGFKWVMWFINKWHLVSVWQEGDLAEAYGAYFLADNPPPYFDYASMEQGVQDFMWGSANLDDKEAFSPYSVAAVDTTSALLQGDIGMDQIKSVRASIAGFNPFLEMAYRILKNGPNNLKNIISDFKKELANRGHVRNQHYTLDELLNQDIDDTLEEAFGDYQNWLQSRKMDVVVL